jgi:ABC-type antimicrobial peptide transport system permease subunit
MKNGILHIVISSLIHYRKSAFNLYATILILAAVITGSLLTGFSVRKSLRTNALQRIGNAGIMISSGVRYFDPELAEEIAEQSGVAAISLLETDGSCGKFGSDSIQVKAKIFGTDSTFFTFLGFSKLNLNNGEAAVNLTLAERLDLKPGDDLILNINLPDDIPGNSPFAPVKNSSGTSVMKVAAIVDKVGGGDFATGINQVIPGNIFINIDDLPAINSSEVKANRIFITSKPGLSVSYFGSTLKNVLSPDDIGLRLRRSPKTGEMEIVSSRIFIDGDILNEVQEAIPECRPAITYLVNSINLGERSTPYSFVAAIDTLAYSGAGGGNTITISRWLSEDLKAKINDTLTLTWYEPGKIRELQEKSGKFIISRITGQQGIWGDSLLMPEFPGIAGSKTCTDWDAGVEISTDRIRDKDEEYWNYHRGTPKAFISYDKGRREWGNNFGPATAIRFPESFDAKRIDELLTGNLDPAKCGFMIKDIREEIIRASSEGVDFSSLFLAMGFFIIASSLFLMVLAVSSYFELKERELFTLFAIGFRDKLTSRLLLAETGIIAIAGSLSGVIAGVLINMLIIKLLNSVWIGAVQTGNLDSYTGIIPVISGFFITVAISFGFLVFRTRKFLKTLRMGEKGVPAKASPRINLIFLISVSMLSIMSLILAFRNPDSIMISFASGGLVFVSLILLWRQAITGNYSLPGRIFTGFARITGSYYKFHSSRGVMPVLLIAAGLFAVIVTGINRLQLDESSFAKSGGTGGFALWAETTKPYIDNLNLPKVRKNLGLDENEFPGLRFVQAKVASGDDASCLNLNYVSSPPLLGIDPSILIEKDAFSFSTLSDRADKNNPWEIIGREPVNRTIFGYADQTVLEWGLKKKTGDTLIFRSESGEQFNVVIAGGLKSSVFQGYLLTGMNNFVRYYPSVAGSTLFLVDCEENHINALKDFLRTRLQSFGIEVTDASRRLESFFTVTNTYLSVFTTLGGFGMILGVAGLGFVLRQNYRSRKREFALMLAAGYREKIIRRYIFTEQALMLCAGVLTGVISAFIATYPTIRGGTGVPWISLISIIIAIVITGMAALYFSLKGTGRDQLVSGLRKE